MNIVLVHGILGFRRELGVEYFRNVAEHFRAQGLAVLVPALDPTRGVEFRGTQLGEQINAGFINGAIDRNQQTHIIAHSMGGLDSRYLLSPISGQRLEAPVRSLTTIGTPHQGSPVADLVDNPLALSPFPHLPFGAAANLFQQALGDLGISLDGLRDLTTSVCQAFSARYSDNPAVAYFSSAGTGRPNFPHTASLFLLFHQYISARTGQPNDGLVAVDSARWGTFDTATWAADHAEEVGHNLDNLIQPPSFPYLGKYDQILARLSAL